MILGIAEKTSTLRMMVVGCDYITWLGLSQLLGHSDFIELASEAAQPAEIMDVFEVEPVDLVLVDASMELEALTRTCRILSEHPQAPTIVVMGDLRFDVAESLIFNGVSAILHNGLITEDLPVVLRMIHRGGAILVSDNARDALMERNNTLDINHRARFNTLNIRERTVARGVAEGLTNLQLATSMHMSEATIKLLVSNVMNKLDVANRVQIAVVTTKAMP